MPYWNWGPKHSEIPQAAFVPRAVLAGTLNTCLKESFDTMEGREAIRKYLKFSRIKIDRDTRFPEPGLYIDINDPEVYDKLEGMYEALITSEGLDQRGREVAKRRFLACLTLLRMHVYHAGYLEDPKPLSVEQFNYLMCSAPSSPLSYFNRSHFEEYYKLQWV